MERLAKGARLAIALSALALPVDAQRADTLVRNVGAPLHAGVGSLVPELTIGGPDATANEYLFDAVHSILAARNGSVFVVDGRTGKNNGSVRLYDRAGKFLRNVGRRGDGPGEWQSPDMVAQLRDGRFILRDAVVGRPLTFYKSNGDFDTTWAYSTSTLFSLRVDTADAIWLRLQAGVGLRGDAAIVTIRVRPSGTVIDTVPEPVFQQLETSTFRVSGERGSTLVAVPYSPRALGAWSPHGYTARAVSTRYAIDLLLPRTLPQGGMRPWRAGDRVVSIRSKYTPVPITDTERSDQIAYMNAQANNFGGIRSGSAPNVPREKPPLRSIAFDLDGRIWAKISQPSERYEAPPAVVVPGRPPFPVIKWREPSVFDVFEPDGKYLGRLAAPYELQLTGQMIQARGDVVWGVVRDSDGVEAVRRYRIAWR